MGSKNPEILTKYCASGLCLFFYFDYKFKISYEPICFGSFIIKKDIGIQRIYEKSCLWEVLLIICCVAHITNHPILWE